MGYPLAGDYLPTIYERLADTGIISIPSNVNLPAMDTLAAAIRADRVDLEIIKGAILSCALSSGRNGPLMIRRANGKLEPSPITATLTALFRNESAFRDILTSLSDEDLGALNQSLLRQHVMTSSYTGLVHQIAHHLSIMLHFDLDLSVFKASVGSEAFKSDLPWLAYDGVLYPASLLCTPHFEAGFPQTVIGLSNRFVEKLIAWTRESQDDPGSRLIDVILSKASVPKDQQTKERRQRKSSSR
jgi:hypothetical protein